MKSIQELIASRQRGGQRSGRKRFKLARQRAVAKMRKFALADPSFFVLELIQSGIAHGASMVHVGTDGEEFSRGGGKFSLLYGGEHYRREELGQLFDFLFTEKGSLENAHLRDLAIGINSMMLFEPKSIELLTGDGTIRGSTHMRVEAGGSTVELGAPDEPVRGVHLLARGLRHPAVQGAIASGLARAHRELGTIARVVEERCMLTPVPVVLNGESISGYSSERSLPLFGYHNRTPVDEGDLYGTLGLTTSDALRGIKLMVRGVWIETVPHSSDVHGGGGRLKSEGAGYIGGALSFDRLRKTADHAGVVRDDRYRELMVRLEPYVRLTRNPSRAEDVAAYRTLAGQELTLTQVRSLALEAERVICLLRHDLGTELKTETRARLEELWQTTGYPVLLSNAQTPDHLLSLSGGESDVIDVWDSTSTQHEDSLLQHYRRPESEPPPEPWLLEPVDVPSVQLGDLVGAIAERSEHGWKKTVGSAREPLVVLGAGVRGLGRSLGTVRARLFTPVESESAHFALPVWVRIGGRTIRRLRAPSAHPGHLLVIDLPGINPAVFDAQVGPEVETELNSIEALDAIAEHMILLAQPAIEAAAVAATRTLVAGIVRPKTTPAYKALSLVARVGTLRWDVEDAGTYFWFSVPAQWESLLDATLFEAVSGDLISLRELGRIMSADRGRVRWTHDRGAGAPDRPRLVLDDIELTCLKTLVGESAMARILVDFKPRPADATAPSRDDLDSPDARVLNVQWVQNRALERLLSAGCAEESFVETAGGDGVSLSFLRGFVERGGKLGLQRRGARRLQLPEMTTELGDEPLELTCTSYELSILGESGICTGWSVETYDDVYDSPLLCTSLIDEPGLVGAIGVPEVAPESYVVVIDSPSGRRALRDDALRFGVCGYLRVSSEDGHGERVRDEARRVLNRALVKVVDASTGEVPAHHERLVGTLTAFAARNMRLEETLDGTAEVAVSDPIAHRVLQLPLFPRPDGPPENALAIVSSIRVGDREPPRAPYASAALNRFVANSLSASALPVGEQLELPEVAAVQPGFAAVGVAITELIETFRPDVEDPVTVIVTAPESYENLAVLVRDAAWEWPGAPRGRVPVLLNAKHSLVARFVSTAEAGDRESVVWLGLLCYAKLNELLDRVTNEHERTFQDRVTSALLSS